MSTAAIKTRLDELQRAMAKAAEALDFEQAARIKSEIDHLMGQDAESGEGGPLAHRPPPGAMGLGTHVPVVSGPLGWKKPKKPDPMTAKVSRRKGPKQ